MRYPNPEVANQLQRPKLPKNFLNNVPQSEVMMSRNLRDLLGNDIIGAVLPIGNIHAVQITKYQWVAYINAEDEPRDSMVDRQVREHCVKENMGGHRIYEITDVDDEVISGGTRKELMKHLKMNHPTWWIEYSVVWNR